MTGVTLAGQDGRQWHVVRDWTGKWWIVLDENRECVSGGFSTRSQAVTEARRLAAEGGAR